METGFRHDNVGKADSTQYHPRSFTLHLQRRGDFSPTCFRRSPPIRSSASSRVATESSTFAFEWTGDNGFQKRDRLGRRSPWNDDNAHSHPTNPRPSSPAESRTDPVRCDPLLATPCPIPCRPWLLDAPLPRGMTAWGCIALLITGSCAWRISSRRRHPARPAPLRLCGHRTRQQGDAGRRHREPGDVLGARRRGDLEGQGRHRQQILRQTATATRRRA